MDYLIQEKTKILYLFKLGTEEMTWATLGFNVETIKKESFGKNITIWDIRGQKREL